EPIFKNYSGNILILYGDMPFITLETINALFNTQIKNNAVCTILTGIVEDPTGYGRIIRNENGEVKAIVEELNATEEEKKIKEINCGIYIFKSEFLFPALQKLKPDPIKGEYYLTDVIKILKDEGRKISTYTTKLIEETIGINTPEDLKKAEKFLTKRRNKWTVV
ncbi:bifunctional UDP-N-acetylglucosamine diphosphorylase/glucosamine-1-phosphate N-acetyltransferase GlmU, partial [bacterium]|nr:bifunctional UDP-N-acetylglucosamine diphosphorylase/glucosamine-1-phosphate N-acetyltransferase GlmU [bacterium]